MITTHGAAGRAVLSVARQVSLSVLGTLAATVVVTALKSEWADRPAAPRSAIPQNMASVEPGLTRGGKFAARALTGHEPEPFVIVTTLPPMLPLFTAATLPPLGRAAEAPRPLTATLTAVAMPGREPPVRSAATSIRQSKSHAPVAAPLPLHPIDASAIALTPLPILGPPVVEDSSFWTRSRSAYRQVADWSDEIVDRLLP